MHTQSHYINSLFLACCWLFSREMPRKAETNRREDACASYRDWRPNSILCYWGGPGVRQMCWPRSSIPIMMMIVPLHCSQLGGICNGKFVRVWLFWTTWFPMLPFSIIMFLFYTNSAQFLGKRLVSINLYKCTVLRSVCTKLTTR